MLLIKRIFRNTAAMNAYWKHVFLSLMVNCLNLLFLRFAVVTITWYKQEDNDIANYRIQENLPRLDAMTLCFRYKPKDSSNELKNKYLITIGDNSMT